MCLRVSARKPKHLDVTTMFTYSHANTPLGQSERAYCLSYFINRDLTGLRLKGFIDLELLTLSGSHTSYCAVLCDMLLMLIESTTNIVTGEMTFQHHFQIKRGGLFVMYFMSSLNLLKKQDFAIKGFSKLP